MKWAERFAAFAARKEREAREAAIYPFTTELDRSDGTLMSIASPWSAAMFDGPFLMSPPPSADRPAASLVFVQSRDGNTVAADPSQLGGGAADTHLIYEGLSRVAADAVLAGAGTVRAGTSVFSVWHPELVALRTSLGQPRHPVQVVATRRPVDFARGPIFNVPEVRVVLITVASCADDMRQALAARPWITPIVLNPPDDLRAAFAALRALGIARLSVVGGRTLATSVIDAGLVQDLYMTTTPIAAGEPNTPMYPRPLGGDVILRKRGTGPDAGVVFEHTIHLEPARGSVD